MKNRKRKRECVRKKDNKKDNKKKRKKEKKEMHPSPRCSGSIVRLLFDKAVYRISRKLFITYTFLVTGL